MSQFKVQCCLVPIAATLAFRVCASKAAWGLCLYDLASDRYRLREGFLATPRPLNSMPAELQASKSACHVTLRLLSPIRLIIGLVASKISLGQAAASEEHVCFHSTHSLSTLLYAHWQSAQQGRGEGPFIAPSKEPSCWNESAAVLNLCSLCSCTRELRRIISPGLQE